MKKLKRVKKAFEETEKTMPFIALRIRVLKEFQTFPGFDLPTHYEPKIFKTIEVQFQAWVLFQVLGGFRCQVLKAEPFWVLYN